jgi:DNA-binding NarL/FixJ family response regulator
VSGPIRVLLADDHAIVRQGLRSILEREADLQVVGEAADGRDAVRKAATLDPDVVVMDITMPLMNGIEATSRIVRSRRPARVVALTMHTAEEYVYSLLKAGARGYVLKDSGPSELIEAIRTVARGGTYLHPRVSLTVVNEYLKRPGPRVRSGKPAVVLSHREREVLQLIAEGHTSKEIAAQLGLSVKTIEAHRARIMDRLKIHNVAGLTRYAIACGIIAAD